MKKIVNIFQYLVFILFLITIVFMKDIYTLLFSIPVFLIVYIFTNKVKIKHYCLFLFALALIIRLITIFCLDVPILDDFKTMYNASSSLLKNDLSFLNTTYFISYGYQLGHVLYQALFLKIFDSVIFLKIINSIVTSLIAVFIYLIAKNISTEKSAKVISLLYLFYLYSVYLNSVLTNQHIPALLVLIVIYLIQTRKDDLKTSLLVAILLAIANFLRPESIVIIIALIIYYFMTNKRLKDTFKKVLVLVISFFLLTSLFSYITYISPLKSSLNNNETLWKFYCGLNYENNGMYNEEDNIKYFSSDNKKKLLINRINDINIKLPLLIIKKEVILWNQTNFDVNIDNISLDLIFKINQGIVNLSLILFLISIFPYKNKINNKTLLITIILFTYYGVYMFIEVSPRYAYILHIIMFTLLGLSIDKLVKLIKK